MSEYRFASNGDRPLDSRNTHCGAVGMDDFDDMTDEELLSYEEYLFDCEADGDDTWAERDQVINEINRRGLART